MALDIVDASDVLPPKIDVGVAHESSVHCKGTSDDPGNPRRHLINFVLGKSDVMFHKKIFDFESFFTDVRAVLALSPDDYLILLKVALERY